jgi:hypothetical protein
MGTFICFEVGIKNEIVDCLTYNTKNEWRCYELKISVSDFHSKQAKTFVGNYNYYVIPNELLDKVKGEIPDRIGIIVDGNRIVKNPKHQDLLTSEKVLYYSIIKSLYRETEKYIKIKQSGNIDEIDRLRKQKNQEIANWKHKYKECHKSYQWMYDKFLDTYQRLRFLQKRAKPEDIEEMRNMEIDDLK